MAEALCHISAAADHCLRGHRSYFCKDPAIEPRPSPLSKRIEQEPDTDIQRLGGISRGAERGISDSVD